MPPIWAICVGGIHWNRGVATVLFDGTIVGGGSCIGGGLYKFERVSGARVGEAHQPDNVPGQLWSHCDTGFPVAFPCTVLLNFGSLLIRE